MLDLDETLIHSHHDGVLRQTVKPGTPADFVLKVNVRVQTNFFSLLSLVCHLRTYYRYYNYYPIYPAVIEYHSLHRIIISLQSLTLY